MQITVFGAGGATGRDVVKEARKRGWRVIAVEREWQTSSPDEQIDRREADVLKDDLAPLVEGSDAVISALGVGLSLETVTNPPPLYTEGTQAIIEAMKAHGVARLVVISASFTQTRDRGPLYFRGTALIGLDRVFNQMEEMEAMLRETDGIDWTAVRPGWLMEGVATRDYTVTPDVIPENLIRTRHADLAHFMVECVENGEWIKDTPAIAREEPDSATSPVQVLSDMVG